MTNEVPFSYGWPILPDSLRFQRRPPGGTGAPQGDCSALVGR